MIGHRFMIPTGLIRQEACVTGKENFIQQTLNVCTIDSDIFYTNDK